MTWRTIHDPMTERSKDLYLSDQEEILWQVLEAACSDNCPPENVEYLCDTQDNTGADEAAVCKQCYLNWAAKAGTPRTPFAKRLIQAIEMACDDRCPPDTKDYVCQAGEDEDTSAENCTRCLTRWAAMPFWKERNRG
jgi:hypothetical protein